MFSCDFECSSFAALSPKQLSVIFYDKFVYQALQELQPGFGIVANRKSCLQADSFKRKVEHFNAVFLSAIQQPYKKTSKHLGQWGDECLRFLNLAATTYNSWTLIKKIYMYFSAFDWLEKKWMHQAINSPQTLFPSREHLCTLVLFGSIEIRTGTLMHYLKLFNWRQTVFRKINKIAILWCTLDDTEHFSVHKFMESAPGWKQTMWMETDEMVLGRKTF